jgi:hypothetical protein
MAASSIYAGNRISIQGDWSSCAQTLVANALQFFLVHCTSGGPSTVSGSTGSVVQLSSTHFDGGGA